MILFAVLGSATISMAQQRFDADSVRAFLEKRMIKVPQSMPSSLVDDLEMLLLGTALGEFRDGAILESKGKAMTSLPQVTPGAMQAFGGSKISSRHPYICPYVIVGPFNVRWLGTALLTDASGHASGNACRSPQSQAP